ncbi:MULTISPECIES: hypothetical protein [unclassified Nocardioides]|uniref:hypothetical protein n=1 Tax=unclassified Nocardioides TaxID=2615069 RepID=UPI000B3C358A|nr:MULTISPECIES: hypothetical protein [unclassified Nocardioides]
MSRPAHAGDQVPFTKGSYRPRPARLGEIEREEWVEIATDAGAVQAVQAAQSVRSPSTKRLAG